MPVSIHLLGIDRLTVQERSDLIGKIWDRLPDSVDRAELPEWHMAEIARRCADAVARPGLGKPWREVLGSL
ncbi:MAG: addiction module protein [Gemmataceae bacterium]|nr:addiction module protein [Gemmataceae bacterium]